MQKNWSKYTDFRAEEDNQQNLLKLLAFFFFFQVLQISLLFVLFHWKKLQLQYKCAAYFTFKEKSRIYSGFWFVLSGLF